MAVVSVRIPRKLKEKMEKYSRLVKWSDEIRRFIEEKIKEIERAEAIKKVEELLKDLPTQPKGSISGIVREERDRH